MLLDKVPYLRPSLTSESIGGPIRTCYDHDWLRGGVLMVLFYLLRTRYALDHQSTVQKITSDEETILSLRDEYNKEEERN
jgi:hypothetical protein